MKFPVPLGDNELKDLGPNLLTLSLQYDRNILMLLFES